MTPPPGPRDWSPAADDPPVHPGGRPVRGAGHVDGLAWARGFAWTSLLFGVATIVGFAVLPLDGQLGRVVWLAFFSTVAIWCGFMAFPRFRALGRRSPVAIIGATLGIAALALAFYIAAVLILDGYGTELPGLPSWRAGTPA